LHPNRGLSAVVGDDLRPLQLPGRNLGLKSEGDIHHGASGVVYGTGDQRLRQFSPDGALLAKP